ncbi:site-specific integrase [Zavarzinella formosa]|uniref:site-specific integrase n=1 Tax=Zavarzinella formosa TaxID=360055 RepID=UPI000378F42B|nr:site-specific integrase [Zavarzinella formosa]
MPRKFLMNGQFINRHARWRKTYKGHEYSVTCAELGLPESEWSELGSYQAANTWWLAKRAEIDTQPSTRPLPPETEDVLRSLKAKRKFAQQEGLPESSTYEAALKEAEAEIESGEIDLPAIDPITVKRLQLLQQLGVKLPEDLDPTTLDAVFGASDLWADRFRRTAEVEQSKRIGTHLNDWYGLVHRRAKASSMVNIAGYMREFRELHMGKTIVLHEEMSVDVLSEAKFQQVFQAIDFQSLAPATKKKKWMFFKSFVSYLTEQGAITPLKNLRSNLFIFKVNPTSKPSPVIAEVQDFLAALPDRLKLYAILALNCSMNNIDMAYLKHDQIDWVRGTLTRKRIKTESSDKVPLVTYTLWSETLRLLKQEMNNKSQWVLTSKTGECLYVSSKGSGSAKPTHYDRIKTQWRDHFGRGEAKKYTLKDFRFFGADLLKKTPYQSLREVYLGHAPRGTLEKNYDSDTYLEEASRYVENLIFPKQG